MIDAAAVIAPAARDRRAQWRTARGMDRRAGSPSARGSTSSPARPAPRCSWSAIRSPTPGTCCPASRRRRCWSAATATVCPAAVGWTASSACTPASACSSRWRARATRPRRTLAVVDWADEEGTRFGRSLLGSAAATGALTGAELDGLTASDGTPAREVVARYGFDAGALGCPQPAAGRRDRRGRAPHRAGRIAGARAAAPSPRSPAASASAAAGSRCAASPATPARPPCRLRADPVRAAARFVQELFSFAPGARGAGHRRPDRGAARVHHRGPRPLCCSTSICATPSCPRWRRSARRADELLRTQRAVRRRAAARLRPGSQSTSTPGSSPPPIAAAGGGEPCAPGRCTTARRWRRRGSPRRCCSRPRPPASATPARRTRPSVISPPGSRRSSGSSAPGSTADRASVDLIAVRRRIDPSGRCAFEQGFSHRDCRPIPGVSSPGR